MALAYDFDIFDIIPNMGSSDPQLSGFLNDVGFCPTREAASVALFRDQRTADALRRAPAGLRAYLMDSGFGLNTYDSGAPPGRYPARDEAARLDLIRRLTENVNRHALPRLDDSPANDDAFHLGAFLAEMDRAEPIEMAPEPLRFEDIETLTPVLLREATIPPTFYTPPISDPEPEVAEAAPRRRAFWNSRFLRLGAAATLVLAAMQLVSGPALTALASL